MVTHCVLSYPALPPGRTRDVDAGEGGAPHFSDHSWWYRCLLNGGTAFSRLGDTAAPIWWFIVHINMLRVWEAQYHLGLQLLRFPLPLLFLLPDNSSYQPAELVVHGLHARQGYIECFIFDLGARGGKIRLTRLGTKRFMLKHFQTLPIRSRGNRRYFHTYFVPCGVFHAVLCQETVTLKGLMDAWLVADSTQAVTVCWLNKGVEFLLWWDSCSSAMLSSTTLHFNAWEVNAVTWSNTLLHSKMSGWKELCLAGDKLKSSPCQRIWEWRAG